MSAAARAVRSLRGRDAAAVVKYERPRALFSDDSSAARSRLPSLLQCLKRSLHLIGLAMKQTQYERFIDHWLAAKSVDEVARSARISKRKVYRIARFLRVAGIRLPDLPLYGVSMAPSTN